MTPVGLLIAKYLGVEYNYTAVLNALCGDHFKTLRYWSLYNGSGFMTSTILDWLKLHFEDEVEFRTIRSLYYGSSNIVTYLIDCRFDCGITFCLPVEFIDDYSFANCPFNFTYE